MNKFLNIISVALYITYGPAAGAQDQEDVMLADLAIPLMDGFSENNEAAMLFDSPDGRIISTQAVGRVALNEVIQYYSAVLPSLGWERMAGIPCEQGVTKCYQAIRDNEILILNFKVISDMTEINYSLSPK